VGYFKTEDEDEPSCNDVPVLSGVVVFVHWPRRMSILQIPSYMPATIYQYHRTWQWMTKAKTTMDNTAQKKTRKNQI